MSCTLYASVILTPVLLEFRCHEQRHDVDAGYISERCLPDDILIASPTRRGKRTGCPLHFDCYVERARLRLNISPIYHVVYRAPWESRCSYHLAEDAERETRHRRHGEA